MDTFDRYRGCLLGLAAGDALGAAVEFRPPGSFPPLTDMVGGGPFGLKPGQWTDDTAMSLCLAESLVQCRSFDARDQMERYCRWWRYGYMSCTGRCFDIGSATRSALDRFLRTGEPHAGSADPHTAGNGSLMRLAPVPLFFAPDPAAAIERAADSSRTTHAAAECVDACRYFAGLIVGAVQGRSKEELLGDHFDPTPGQGCWKRRPLAPRIAEIAAGSFRRKEPPDIRGRGYVVACLEAALWAFARAGNYADAALRAANLGDDADTTAAVAGQLAGAHYGAGGIPAGWLKKLAMRDVIEGLADRLCALAQRPPEGPPES